MSLVMDNLALDMSVPPHQISRLSPVKLTDRRRSSRFYEHLTKIPKHLHTLLLFTYTDYKTIFVPITVFGIVAAPVHSINRFLHAILWIWLHLLQCNVSNQYKSAEEDAINRPWRPVPSGRVTLTEVSILRICLVPICLGISSTHAMGVIMTSAGLMATMVIYDELGLSRHWIGKNLCNVSGYVMFEIGATKIMGKSHQLDATALQAIIFSACVILTTIQAQDFSDIAGDLEVGRITFPIYAPAFSRAFTLFAIMTWSIVLGIHWSLGVFARLVFFSLGTIIGWRYYRLRTPEQDTRSYLIFNVWLFLAHLLPSQARWKILGV